MQDGRKVSTPSRFAGAFLSSSPPAGSLPEDPAGGQLAARSITAYYSLL